MVLYSIIWSNLARRTFEALCRIRYMMCHLRRDRSFATVPLCLHTCSHSCLTSQLVRLPGALKNVKHKFSRSFFLTDFIKEARNIHSARFYSSSNRNTFKVEAPVGIFNETLSGFHASSLGGRLGRSFHQLSRHINVYFKKKHVVALAENPGFLVTASECPGRSQRHRQGQRSMSGSKSTLQEITETSSSDQKSGLQLFHISSLTTRFGEGYTYVANHINSVFTKTHENTEKVFIPRGTNRRQKRRKVQNNGEKCQIKSEQIERISRSWENESFPLARNVNTNFAANVIDRKNTQPASQTFSTTTLAKQEEPVNLETGRVFHSGFTENLHQTSGHISPHFKVKIHKDVLTEPDQRLKTASFIDCFRNPKSAIPDFLGGFLKITTMSQTANPTTKTSPPELLSKKVVLNHRQAEETTRGLISSLSLASSPQDLTACIEAINEHIVCYPSCKASVWQEKAAVTLLRQRRIYRHDQRLQAALREALALIGYVDPVKGRGIRVLSIDGGGTRGVVPLQMLKLLEEETGRKIHELFDYICGVSTGAVLAFMLGLARFSLEECADMYRRFGSEVFRQNPLVGTVKMGWSHSYYNTETWERILQEKLGNRVLVKTARDALSPKVSAVSAVVNWGTSPKAFVFRNYNHKPGSLSRYAGSSSCPMWQAVRASSAAPGYFQEFTLQSDIHQDGGIILNNPCALAVHESRLLWPKQPFQCVLSLGTGRYDNARKGPATSTSLRAKISNLICSATDTEGVHTLLDELLAPDVYFRFNPMLSAEVSLDENRPGALDQLQKDTQEYLERNRLKLVRLCLVLGAERSSVGKAKDWMNERAWEMKQRLL